MRKLLLFLFFFALTSLAASESSSIDVSRPEDLLANPSPYLANIEGEPSSIIHGCVSIITGDYHEAQTDLIIPGSEPLILERYYSSSDNRVGTLLNSWNFNVGGFMVHQQSKKHVYAVTKGGGGELVYKAKLKYPTVLDIDSKMLEKGVTNTSSGKISGQTNIKNNWMSFYKDYERCTLSTGSGVKYLYAVSEGANEQKNYAEFFLLKTFKPNGTYILTYANRGLLTTAGIYNNLHEPLTLLKLYFPTHEDFKDHKKHHTNPQTTVVTRDGRKITYKFQIFKGRYGRDVNERRMVLIEAQRPHAPTVKYTYAPPNSDYLERITRKDLPKGRFLEIDYHKSGKEKGKVKMLKGPVGSNAAAIPLYTFQYVKGMTHVFDSYNNKTSYAYSDKDHRLTSIIRYRDGNTLHSNEKMYWGEPETADYTNLITRTLQDHTGAIRFARNYTYDSSGNVLCDRLYGNLTGKGDVQLAMDGKSPNKNQEHYQQTHNYSNTMNLLVETSDGTATTAYEYYPDTNLVKAKFLKSDGVIRIREFFKYDKNAALIKHIIDDGSTTDSHNLQGVTERRIKKIIPSTTISTKEVAPLPVGLPLIVEEYALSAGFEVLLRKTENHYCPIGRLKRQDIYDSQNHLAYSLEWDHDWMGNVIKEVDALGHVTQRKYDDNGNLEFEQGPRGDVHYKFTYDLSNRLLCKTEVHAGGQNLTTHYRYDYRGNKVSEVDIYGNETIFVYDAMNQLRKTVYPMVLNENGQPVVPETNQDYDVMGYLSMKTDLRGFATHISNTVRGKPYCIQYPDGSVERFEYSLKGDLVKATAKDGAYTLYEYDYQSRPISTKVYDPSGKLLSSSSKTYNAFHLTSETDPAGYVTTYSYDHAGRLASVCKEDSFVEYFYDTLGRQQEVRTWYGPHPGDYIRQMKAYDLLNQVIEEYELTDGCVQNKCVYTYDEMGNRTTVTTYSQAGQAVDTTHYNARGQVERYIDPLGHETRTTYRYDYVNSLGQRVPYTEICDPLGRRTVIIQDALSREATVMRLDPFGRTIQKTTCFHDEDGNPLHEIDTWITPDAPDQEVHTYRRFDRLSRLVALIEAGGVQGLEKVFYFHYDTAGRMICRYKSDSREIRYDYDYLGRLAEFYDKDGTFHYRYEYDPGSNPIAVHDMIHDTATLRTYDSHNRLLEEKLANGLVMTYAYDRMGRPNRIVYPDQSAVIYDYASSLLQTVTRLDATKTPVYHHTYMTYDSSSNLLEARLIGKAGELSYNYDLHNRPTQISHNVWSETDAFYDPMGNLLHRTVHDNVNRTHCEYLYDNLDQLAEETGLAKHKFVNDSRYNHAVKDKYPQKYNALNQLEEDLHTHYEYDACGNLRKKITEDQVIEYFYDSLDRLIKVSSPEGIFEYYYDSFNRRLSKISPDGMQHFFYASQNELGSSNESGTLIETRVLALGNGAEIGAAIAVELDGKVYAPIHDHVGNVCMLLNSTTGQPFETYRYSAFGSEQIYLESGDLTNSSSNPWRYASKRADPETGFIYFGERYYDPATCRWVTTDPIGKKGGPNLYAYVLNNPLVFVDPEGLSPYMQSNANENTSSQIAREEGWFQRAKHSVSDVFFNPRFQGALQTVGGALEVVGGAGLISSSVVTYGWGGVVGWPVIVHGLDQTATGFNTLYSGVHHDTATSQLLQKTGISAHAANVVDSTLSMAATMGATVVTNAARSTALPAFSLTARNATTLNIKIIDPQSVRFSQSSISNKFKDGSCIDDLVLSLKNGSVKPYEVSPIRLVNRDNLLFTLDNRRLEAFRRAEIKVPYKMATIEEIAAEEWKFTTSNNGKSTRVRGK